MTLIVAPAILTNAMSVLALGSGNRLARAIDRFREHQRDLERLEAGSPLRESKKRRLERVRSRARLLLRAMQAFFTALGCFASTTLVAVVGSALGAFGHAGAAKAVAVVALGAGALGIACLLFGCVQLVLDTRLAVAGLDEDADAVR